MEKIRQLIDHRRRQADSIEKNNPPKLGEWNVPEMLRDDADAMEELLNAVLTRPEPKG